MKICIQIFLVRQQNISSVSMETPRLLCLENNSYEISIYEDRATTTDRAADTVVMI